MRRQVWLASFIVFVGSACSLIIELVAGRILAPFVGVSLYTWTSVIGVVLAGASLGNYIGGRLADKWASRTTLGILFFIGGFASLSILPMANMMTESILPAGTPFLARILIYATSIFFVPSFVLGTLSPLVVKLTLRDLEHAGNVVGQIYAFWAVGSIFGTFLTGFVLISYLGTRTIVWVVAIVLLVMGAVFGDFLRLRKRSAATVVVFLLLGLAYWAKGGEYKGPCLIESNYFCIRVHDSTIRDMPGVGPVKALALDHLLHSYVALENPRALGYEYERIYAEITDYQASQRGGKLATAFIGGGGYTFPRYIETVYPGSTIDVAEIDPAVTRVAFDYLALNPQTTIRSTNEDARMFFSRPPTVKYDLVYGDAFNDLSVPYHLTTRQFDEKVRNHLKDDGIYLLNMIDSFTKGEFLRAVARTLQATYGHVYVLGPGYTFDTDAASTYVLLASTRPFDLEEFRQYTAREGNMVLATPLPAEELETYLQKGRDVVLTDDYCPVDQMLAPIFQQRGL